MCAVGQSAPMVISRVDIVALLPIASRPRASCDSLPRQPLCCRDEAPSFFWKGESDMHTRTALISVRPERSRSPSAPSSLRQSELRSSIAQLAGHRPGWPRRRTGGRDPERHQGQPHSVSCPGGQRPAPPWPRTDSLHRINLMTSSDGLHYVHKLTLSETTINRPAVARGARLCRRGGGARLARHRQLPHAERPV